VISSGIHTTSAPATRALATRHQWVQCGEVRFSIAIGDGDTSNRLSLRRLVCSRIVAYSFVACVLLRATARQWWKRAVAGSTAQDGLIACCPSTVGGWLANAANATTHVPHGPNPSNKEHILISSIDFEALVKQFNVWMVIGAFYFFFFFFFFFNFFLSKKWSTYSTRRYRFHFV
jgi:hypothetical protein